MNTIMSVAAMNQSTPLIALAFGLLLTPPCRQRAPLSPTPFHVYLFAPPHTDRSAMVEATHGVLVTCDIPVKQFLLKLDNDRAPDRFIVAKLDDTHLFIHGWAVDMIKDQLEKLFSENQYESLN